MYKNINFVSADEAVKVVKSGDHIHFSSVASAPKVLIDALCRRGDAGELRDVRIHHLHTEGAAPYTDAKYEGIFFHQAFFVGGNVRKSVQAGYADYIPIFLSETQKLYRSGVVPCNVAMIQVSLPDKHGYVSLGTSVDATLAAIECAEYVIAVVNKHVPRAFGDAMIPLSMIDIFVECDSELEPAHFSEPSEIETAIGNNCAALIEDGATLQMGIGAIPNAVLAQLGNHKNLGIHTEMFADGVLPLVEKGVINGAEKAIDRGKLVSTFLMGSQKVYDFIDDNPMVAMMDVGYTNDPFIIAKNPKVTAINSALQVDITGQVCADSLGTTFYSGVGGQIDFIYGASQSKGGKAIIAMPSVTNKGVSKIAPVLNLGAGVVTTRNHIHWFVTEYGAVNLYGKSLQERAKLIISVAHPDHREALDKAAFERFGPHFHFIG
ncbi:MAG: acetyl-CoA hydrolase/transferase family protein [Bacteroidales bacterium]|jgi:acyl-CoA hydrolase|nr:acetyl-CoA hydrolase/transferase family protein [Bacteroidales bacterium]MBO7284383.1 acetyl-CoA hydrolase/transferase family protein [Bacteroidales bacterium]MBO7322601.1 acetyl-CoA hydrolase/transferase family protein [Bacteroidales bacterium]MBQ1279828.1 acetyl-CoA hydrolase/transferase family protein [Bacteroidales bacterium]MBQ5747361.1 acetyl-CoA hydrolase/transferase family protein [Bacteroidales bacterium]